ncbi:MAG: HDIG domain-containing protein [Tannerella sp.]|jgi:uncharacterized protein|nr:HDIG domain-containing protein [Tannerella sp.]
MYNKIIEKYYDKSSDAYRILINHSRSVADKALAIAERNSAMKLDLQFIEQAAMLHDIGMIFCYAPAIDCYGTYPYICHGYLGAELVRKEGYEKHALVCERHTGTGISLTDIINRNLPLPHRDFMPLSAEEQLICFADKFYSKTSLNKEKSIDKVEASLGKWGADDLNRFQQWLMLFT